MRQLGVCVLGLLVCGGPTLRRTLLLPCMRLHASIGGVFGFGIVQCGFHRQGYLGVCNVGVPGRGRIVGSSWTGRGAFILFYFFMVPVVILAPLLRIRSWRWL